VRCARAAHYIHYVAHLGLLSCADKRNCLRPSRRPAVPYPTWAMSACRHLRGILGEVTTQVGQVVALGHLRAQDSGGDDLTESVAVGKEVG